MYFHVRNTLYVPLIRGCHSLYGNKGLIANHDKYFTISFDFRKVTEKFSSIQFAGKFEKAPAHKYLQSYRPSIYAIG